MRMMKDRKAFLLVLWLAAMSSLDLSMGKITPGKEIRKDKAHVAHGSAPNERRINKSKVAENHDSKFQKGGNMANTGKKGGETNYAAERREQGRKLAEIIASRGKEIGKDKAHAAHGSAPNERRINKSKVAAPQTDKAVYTNFTKSPSVQASSNVAQKGGDMVNTAPSKHGGAKDHISNFQKGDDTTNATPSNQGGANGIASNNKGGDMTNKAPSKQGGGNDPASKFHKGNDMANTGPSNQGGAKDHPSEFQKGGYMANPAPSQQGGPNDLASKFNKGDDMEKKIPSKQGGAKDEHMENTASKKQGGERDYDAEKRHQGRKLAEIIASRGKDKANAANAFASYKVGAAIEKASNMAGEVVDNAPDMAIAAKRMADEMARYAMNMASDMANEVVDNAPDMASVAKRMADEMARYAMNMASDIAGEVVDNAPNMASDFKRMVEEMTRYAKNKALGMTNDAKNKAVHMANIAKGKAANMASDAWDAKDTGTDKMAAASEYAKHKAELARNTASEMGWNALGYITPEKVGEAMHKASNAYAYAFDKIDDKIKMATKKGREAKERWDDLASPGKAFETYIEAKAKAREAYEFAKHTMTENAKKNYEVAKEKASEATGKLGAYMGGDGVWDL